MAGDIGPFQVAIALTVITLGLLIPWRENYGEIKLESSSKSTQDENKENLNMWIHRISSLFIKNPVIIFLGLSQAFFEGAVYTFGTIYNYTISYIFF